MKIFITYCRSCKDQVLSLSQDLKALNHRVRYDRDLGGGQSWWDQILAQIRDCEVYIFLISKDAIDSTACIRELKYAEALQKSVLPVLIDDSVSIPMLPRYLSNIQYIDYRNPDDKQAAFALVKAISLLKASPPIPDPLPEPPPVPISYLDTLKEKVDAPNLTKQDQIILVRDLKSKLDDPQTSRKDIETLLRKLRGHQDLLATVAIDIDEILKDSGKPRSSSAYREPVNEPLYQSVEPPRPQPNINPIAATIHPPTATTGKNEKSWSTLVMVLVIGATLFFPIVGIIAGFIAYSSASRSQGKTLLIISAIMMGLYLLLFIAGGGYY